jgi:hypothetical protein
MSVSSVESGGSRHEHHYISQIVRLACRWAAGSEFGRRHRGGICAGIAQRTNTGRRTAARNFRTGVAHASAIDWRRSATFYFANEYAGCKATAIFRPKQHAIDGADHHATCQAATVDRADQHSVNGPDLHASGVAATVNLTEQHAAGHATTLHYAGWHDAGFSAACHVTEPVDHRSQARNRPRPAGHGPRRCARPAGDGAGVRARLIAATDRR